MKRSYFLYSNGTLKRKDNTITFVNEKEEKKDIPIEMIGDFYIMSEMNFNTKFINYISQFGIPIHFFNYYTFYTGSFYPRKGVSLDDDSQKYPIHDPSNSLRSTLRH